MTEISMNKKNPRAYELTNLRATLILWTILTLSIAGFADATYLAINNLVGSPVKCYGSSGCAIVDASPYSVIAGIPLSVFGVLFYALTIILLVQFFLRKQKQVLYLAAATVIVGGVFAIYLFALQAFVINAWCFYCIISDTIGIINAVLIIYLLRASFLRKQESGSL